MFSGRSLLFVFFSFFFRVELIRIDMLIAHRVIKVFNAYSLRRKICWNMGSIYSFWISGNTASLYLQEYVIIIIIMPCGWLLYNYYCSYSHICTHTHMQPNVVTHRNIPSDCTNPLIEFFCSLFGGVCFCVFDGIFFISDIHCLQRM